MDCVNVKSKLRVSVSELQTYGSYSQDIIHISLYFILLYSLYNMSFEVTVLKVHVTALNSLISGGTLSVLADICQFLTYN